MTEEHRYSGTIYTEAADPIKVELTRGQRGGYGWEITVKGSEWKEVMLTIALIDTDLRNKYITDEVA